MRPITRFHGKASLRIKVPPTDTDSSIMKTMTIKATQKRSGYQAVESPCPDNHGQVAEPFSWR